MIIYLKCFITLSSRIIILKAATLLLDYFMSSKPISDAGVNIPHAKKHSFSKSQKKQKNKQGHLTLKSLWPQPNWVELLESGCELEAVIYLAVLYHGFRNTPRDSFSCVNFKMWEEAFVDSINILKKLFASVQTIEDAKSIKSKLYLKLGIQDSDFGDNQLHITYPAYALGRGGSRRIYTTMAFSERQHKLTEWIELLNWPYNKSAMKTKLFPVEFTDGTWGLGKPNRRSWTVPSEHYYPDKESCVDAFTTMYVQNKDKPYNPDKPLFDLKSTVVNKDDVTGDDIINDFGFRGVQFGRSMSNSERQLWLNQVYHALDVFSKLINIPNKRWMGLGGLGIAFGARGSGNAMAHYEPTLNVINLTKKTGASCLGHEWFHALDHHLMKNVNINTHFQFATRAMVWVDANYLKNNCNLSEHYLILKSLFDLDYGSKSTSKFVSQARNLSAQYGGRKYWATTVELYARSFEAYIQDKLIKENVSCPWLVLGTLEHDYPEDQHHKHPYPIGKERLELYDKWESFLQSMFGRTAQLHMKQDIL